MNGKIIWLYIFYDSIILTHSHPLKLGFHSLFKRFEPTKQPKKSKSFILS